MLELVFCVGHSITFCVLRSAFQHNIPTLLNAVAVLPKKEAFQVLKNNFDSKKQHNGERPRLPESALETFSEETRQHWDEYFPEARMEWVTSNMNSEDFTERNYADCKPSNDLRAKYQWVYVPKYRVFFLECLILGQNTVI